jgi:hypothetical protein
MKVDVVETFFVKNRTLIDWWSLNLFLELQSINNILPPNILIFLIICLNIEKFTFYVIWKNMMSFGLHKCTISKIASFLTLTRCSLLFDFLMIGTEFKLILSLINRILHHFFHFTIDCLYDFFANGVCLLLW